MSDEGGEMRPEAEEKRSVLRKGGNGGKPW
jgi:hypothetical protein